MFKLFKVTIIFLTFFLSSGFFYIGPPFKFSDSFEELSDDTEVVVGITHVLLGDDEEKNELFWEKADSVIASLSNQQGYLGHRIRKKLFSNEAWTMTVWKNSSSLNEFVRSDIHSGAIRDGLSAVKQARSVRFTALRFDIPLSWDIVEKQMEENGRKLY